MESFVFILRRGPGVCVCDCSVLHSHYADVTRLERLKSSASRMFAERIAQANNNESIN